MTLRWRRMRYMVSYHNNRLWGILHINGGSQEVPKVDTNKFVSLTMCAMIFVQRPQNHVITIKEHAIVYHQTRKSFRLKSTKQSFMVTILLHHVKLLIYAYTLYKLLVQVLLLEVHVLIRLFWNPSGHLLHYYSLYHNNIGLPTQCAIFMLSCHTLSTSIYRMYNMDMIGQFFYKP